jgi:hypothetical protein
LRVCNMTFDNSFCSHGSAIYHNARTMSTNVRHNKTKIGNSMSKIEYSKDFEFPSQKI